MRHTSYKINQRKGKCSVASCGHMLAVILLTLTLGTACLAGSVLGAVAADSLSLPDLSDPAGTAVPMPKGDVVAELVGGITSAEYEYLSAHGQHVLYTAAIPADRMYAHVHNNGVTVVAYDYTYTTADGIVVTWMPLFAENLTTPTELADMVYDSRQGLYVAALEGARSDQIKVYFAASFTLSEEVALTLVNEAPEKALLLMAAMQAYEDALALWTPKQEAYEAYLAAYEAWEAAMKAYEVYLAEKAVYDTWWQEHDEKKAAMDAYLEKKAAYDAWVQYGLDLKAYEDYMALVNASPELKAEYEKKMTTALGHLAIMDRMFIKSEISGYSFEGVLNSGAAQYVINNKNLLLNVTGVNKEDVNKAVAATYALRDLVGGYHALTDPEAKYDYYIAHRDEMVTYMMDLCNSMISLGEVEFVYEEIVARDGLDAYRQFLGNLYVQGCLMDDSETLDPDKVFFDIPLAELVEPELTLEDTDLTTPLDAYPHPPTTSDDVPEVPYPGDPPSEAEDPGEAPDPVPDTADAPAFPEEVLPAGDEPEMVLPPEDRPIPPAMNAEEQALYEAAMRGELGLRTVEDLFYGGMFSIMMSGETTTLSGKTVEIKVMNYRGAMQSTQYLAFGSSLMDTLTPPRAYAANGALLTFVGWSYELTPLPDSVDDVYDTLDAAYAVADMTLYPVYRLDHTPGAEATCTTDQVCLYCGDVLTERLGHHYETEITKPTCTEGGHTTYTCTVCGDTYDDDETEALGHSYETEVTKPTCTEGGYTTYTCTVCGDTYDGGKTEALGHSYETEVTKPTCTEDGYTTYTCTACGDTYDGGKTEALGHSYEIEVTKPTCTEDGHTTYTCTVCGDTYDGGKTEALGHNYETEVIKPTCTEDGHTTYTCTVCGDTYDDDETEALGHSYETEVTKPTCTEGGHTTYTCSVCEDTYTDDETEALGHSYETEVIKPTCTEDGHTTYTCTVCGDTYDGDKTEALGHNYETEVTKPTCTEDGYTTYTCTACGDMYDDDETEALGHQWCEWETILPPTEEIVGIKYRSCSICLVEEEGIIPELDHVHVHEPEIIQPTCTEEGYTRHTCRCGDSYRDTYVTALGHKYETEITEPTCTEDGYTTYTCSVCDDNYVDDETEAWGHSYETEVTEPTCTEDGYTTYTCTVCGVTHDSDETEAWGHTGGTAATCTEDQTCIVCGVVMTEKLGHQYKNTVKKPTCTEVGYTVHSCTRCGDSYEDGETAATGHRYGEWIVDRQPAPEVEGYRYAECQICGYRMEETLPALSPAETDTRPGTETETIPEPETDTEPDTDEQDTEPVTDEETDTEPVTDAETDTEPNNETDRGTASDAESETPPEPGETTTQGPTMVLPEVKWYAKVLGAVGLPGLVTIIGVVLGGGTAGVAILIMRALRKRRLKK